MAYHALPNLPLIKKDFRSDARARDVLWGSGDPENRAQVLCLLHNRRAGADRATHGHRATGCEEAGAHGLDAALASRLLCKTHHRLGGL